jgi:hypothetical protein
MIFKQQYNYHTSFITCLNQSITQALEQGQNKISIENKFRDKQIVKFYKLESEEAIQIALDELTLYTDCAKGEVGYENMGKFAYHVGLVLDQSNFLKNPNKLQDTLHHASKDIRTRLTGTWFASADILIHPTEGIILNMIFETQSDSYLDTILC